MLCLQYFINVIVLVRPVSTTGMFSKPSIGISYQRDHNQYESGVCIKYVLFFNHWILYHITGYIRSRIFVEHLISKVLFLYSSICQQ